MIPKLESPIRILLLQKTIHRGGGRQIRTRSMRSVQRPLPRDGLDPRPFPQAQQKGGGPSAPPAAAAQMH